MGPLPQHIAIIMDGNGRWASQRDLPRVAGHRAGESVVDSIVEHCGKKNIPILTLFAFGLDNLQRPADEIRFLMQLMQKSLNRHIKRLHQQNVQLRVIGDRSYLSDAFKHEIESAELLTHKNSGLILVVALHYSGHWDIAQAVKKMLLSPTASDSDISKQIQHHLAVGDLPPPDLLIRTSGEQRLSNFMLWQLAYTELYFTESHWPDFTVEELEKALLFYQHRQRRFGLTPQQII